MKGTHNFVVNCVYTCTCTDVTPPWPTVISLAVCSISMSKLKWAPCSLPSQLPSNQCLTKQMASELVVRLVLYTHALILYYDLLFQIIPWQTFQSFKAYIVEFLIKIYSIRILQGSESWQCTSLARKHVLSTRKFLNVKRLATREHGTQ